MLLAQYWSIESWKLGGGLADGSAGKQDEGSVVALVQRLLERAMCRTPDGATILGRVGVLAWSTPWVLVRRHPSSRTYSMQRIESVSSLSEEVVFCFSQTSNYSTYNVMILES